VRLLTYAAAEPAWNMAVDEALLRLAPVPTLRFYGWNPPALSLGRFQEAPADAREWAAEGLRVVRRMTGGGAIVHWHELTYAVTLPLDHELLRGAGTRESYARLHEPIREALARLGVESGPRPKDDARDAKPDRGSRESFLCFHRTTTLDIVAAGRKLVGSAQRRTAGRLLQHGSIVLAENPWQQGTASLEAITGRRVDPAELARAIAEAFVARLGRVEAGTLGPDEDALAASLVDRYRVA
jgi:lipoate-protein ligase A